MMNGLEIIYKAVDDINENQGEQFKIVKSPDTVLLGDGSSVDSLQLVNLVSTIELIVQDDFGKSIALVDEAVFSAPEQPLSTLGSLAAYVDKLMV